MNFENKIKTLPESTFFFYGRESSSTFNKKEAQRMASYRKGTSKDGSAKLRADATKAELAQRYQKYIVLNHPFFIFL